MTDGRTETDRDEQKDGRTERRMTDGRTERWTDRETDGQMKDGQRRTERQTDRDMNEQRQTDITGTQAQLKVFN